MVIISFVLLNFTFFPGKVLWGEIMLVTVRGWKVNRQWFKTMTSSRDEQIAREDLSELTVQVKFGSQRKWCVNLTLTENITFFMALGWTPESWRARGRPKATCRRTVVRERGKVGWKSWNLAKVAAPDRGGWVDNVTALCTYWRSEQWWWWW